MHTYPAGFSGLLDPMLKTPFTENSTWHDATYTLAKAEALGRLDGVTRVWLVEYAVNGHADKSGIATLTAAGFTQRGRIDNYRSAILEFERASS
jgi:mannosyltransferase